MNKQQTKDDRIHFTVNAMNRSLKGPEGHAKDVALRVKSVMCEPYDLWCLSHAWRERRRIDPNANLHNPSEAELNEMARRRIVKALETCDSPSFKQITEIATALNNKDSDFFTRISRGLDQIPSGHSLEVMEIINRAYTAWTFPGATFGWTHPLYKKFVDAGLEPTKKQMREIVLRFWAIDRLIFIKRSIRVCYAYDEQPRDVEHLIAKEIKEVLLPKNLRWSDIWKAAGLDYLKADRPGPKPSKRSLTKKI
jgi:hypothetical protein